jgi:hypothetical protein
MFLLLYIKVQNALSIFSSGTRLNKCLVAIFGDCAKRDETHARERAGCSSGDEPLLSPDPFNLACGAWAGTHHHQLAPHPPLPPLPRSLLSPHPSAPICTHLLAHLYISQPSQFAGPHWAGFRVEGRVLWHPKLQPT